MPKYYNASIKNLTYRLRRFKPILEKCLMEELKKHQQELKAIICDQLYSGIDGYNEDIYPPYTIRTRKYKLKHGQPIDRVTLRDSGEFYNSLRVEFDNDGFRIVSDDDKAKHLLKKYGPEVLRITNTNLTTFLRLHIKPVLGRELKKYLSHERT